MALHRAGQAAANAFIESFNGRLETSCCCHPPAKKLLSQPKCVHCAAISTHNDFGFPFISQRASALVRVIGLAMILIVIAIGVGDR
jgi:hypothetical protein